LRSSTERIHIPEKYITILENYDKLVDIFYKIPKQILPSCNVYGNGSSAIQIAKHLSLI